MERESVYILVGNGPFAVVGRLDCTKVELLSPLLSPSDCLIETVNGRTLVFDPGVVFKDKYSQIESQPDELSDPTQRPDQFPMHKPPAALRINA